MARNFVAASSNTLIVASAPVTAIPLTMAVWFKPVAANVAYSLMGVDNGATSNRFELETGSGGASGSVRCATNAAVAGTSTSFSAGVWAHACGVFTTAAARAVFLNGGGKGTNTTSATPAGINRTALGVTGATGFFNGVLAEAAIWNVALTDDEVLKLGSTTSPLSPLMVRPNALVFYAPLLTGQSPEVELFQGRNLTLSGTTVVDHPRIFYPRKIFAFSRGTTAVDGNASGGTLTATASLVSGAGSGAASAAGATLTATASLTAGTATGGTDGSAAGATLTTTASLVSGAATGDAAAAGATLTATASLVAGAATGGAAAAGATLAATASLIDGAATGGATGAGATLTATASLIEGEATGEEAGDVTVEGVTLEAIASLIAGGATGQIIEVAPVGAPASGKRKKKEEDEEAFTLFLAKQKRRQQEEEALMRLIFD